MIYCWTAAGLPAGCKKKLENRERFEPATLFHCGRDSRDKLTPVKWDAIQVKKKGDKQLSFMTILDKARLTQEKSFDKSS